jgi:hypothetical protein
MKGTTHQYVEVDMEMKERALARLQEPTEAMSALPASRCS